MTNFLLWGVTASPYYLKMQSMLDYSGRPYRRLPQRADRWTALTTAWRLRKARRHDAVLRFPTAPSGLDEYPAVPYYSEDGRTFYYDSSSLARHLDEWSGSAVPRLIPEDAGRAFICRLIDEAFDEFGLYMVHHNRWVLSASSNTMGVRTAGELGALLPPGMQGILARRLARRQVRRCPYLFSVAAENFVADVESALTPPSREGFPPTHALLDDCWRNCLGAMESLLQRQAYLLGPRFTLADASAYGQLSMNLTDGIAAERLQELAPRTYEWLAAIRDGGHKDSSGEPVVTPALDPLLQWLGETFVPLMEQNHLAYRAAVAAGETRFNEAAFDADRALYDGELRGRPFRAVVKTFQVQVWRDLLAAWAALSLAQRESAARTLPATTVAALDGGGSG